MPGKSGRSLTFCGRVLYAHSTICSKLSGFVAETMGNFTIEISRNYKLRGNQNQQRRTGVSAPHDLSPRRGSHKQVPFGFAHRRLSTSLAALRSGSQRIVGMTPPGAALKYRRVL